MKKLNILKENEEFERIIKNNKSIKYKYFIFYIEKNTNNIYKFGLSVGKKIGNAVVRNKVKRQIKDILDKNDYQNNFNCIIIVRNGINQKKYNEIDADLNDAINLLEIVKEKWNE